MQNDVHSQLNAMSGKVFSMQNNSEVNPMDATPYTALLLVTDVHSSLLVDNPPLFFRPRGNDDLNGQMFYSNLKFTMFIPNATSYLVFTSTNLAVTYNAASDPCSYAPSEDDDVVRWDPSCARLSPTRNIALFNESNYLNNNENNNNKIKRNFFDTNPDPAGFDASISALCREFGYHTGVTRLTRKVPSSRGFQVQLGASQPMHKSRVLVSDRVVVKSRYYYAGFLRVIEEFNYYYVLYLHKAVIRRSRAQRRRYCFKSVRVVRRSTYKILAAVCPLLVLLRIIKLKLLIKAFTKLMVNGLQFIHSKLMKIYIIMRLHSKIMVLNAQLLMLYTLYYYQSFTNWLWLADEKKIPTIKIAVKTLSGEQFDLVVSCDMNFMDFKKNLVDKYLQDIPVQDVRLIFNGKAVSDLLTPNHYCMKDDDCLFLVLSLNGGAPKKRPNEKKDNNVNNNPVLNIDQDDDPMPQLENIGNNADDNDNATEDDSDDKQINQENSTVRIIKLESEIC